MVEAPAPEPGSRQQLAKRNAGRAGPADADIRRNPIYGLIDCSVRHGKGAGFGPVASKERAIATERTLMPRTSLEDH